MAHLPKFNIFGHAHFVTTNTHHRRHIFRNEKCCEILISEINFYRNKLRFKLIGYCIMLDHLHMIIWWDPGTVPHLVVSAIMHRIKNHSARSIIDSVYHTGGQGPLTLPPRVRLGQGTQATRAEYPHKRMSRQQYQVWQPSFYDFNIYSEDMLHQKLDYIHLNPVRAGLVRDPVDWKYSSARNYYLGDESMLKIDRLL